LSRRKFLYGTGALALAPVALSQLELPKAFAAEAAKPTNIIRRKLGRTGLEVPIVSMGVMRADNPAVVQESINIGVRLFDTADGYQNGLNEEMIGRVVSNMNARDRVYIQTKSRISASKQPPPPTAAERRQRLLTNLDASLARLNTDYVDIFLVHDPTTDMITDSGVKEALAEMKKQGKARHVGFATHSNQAEQLNIAAKDGSYDTITLSFNFTMADNRALLEAVRNATNAGIGLIAMKTQASTGKAGPPTNHTAALKWALRNEEIVTAIPGYMNFDHMRENFSVATDGLEYTNTEREFLSGLNIQAMVQFCRQCGECRSTCPLGIDIPTLMRTHMYAAGYGDFVLARTTLDEIASNVNIHNCSDCSTCSAKCSNFVCIADNIRDLKAMYV
jgi:predicted aldo/keto reductase-like oxidoreductase